jgi:hypothetical protein
MQIKSKCSYDKLVEVGDLKPNPDNPNRHPKKQIDLLAKMVKAQGWRTPITVSKRSGMIVAGHARFEVAKLLKVKKVPVDYQDFDSAKQEWSHLVADNKIQEFSQFDHKMLKELIADLDEIHIDLLAFDQKAIDDILSEGSWNPPKYKGVERGDDINKLVGYGLQSFWKDISNKAAPCFKYQIGLPHNISGALISNKYSRSNLTEMERIIKTYMRKGDFFLENCCGWSTFGSSAKYFGFSGVGIDIWDVAINHSLKQIANIPGKGRIDIVKGDGMKTPFKNSVFDYVFCGPPFMAEEKYSQSGKEIGDKKLPNFFWNIYYMMREHYRILKSKCLCTILINDVREKNYLLPVQKYVIEAGFKAGFLLHDFVIAEVLSQRVRLRKKDYNLKRTVKSHEYVITFRKR